MMKRGKKGKAKDGKDRREGHQLIMSRTGARRRMERSVHKKVKG
jgi:hypothetical protein